MKKSIMSFFGGKEDFEDREAKGKQEEGKAGRPSRRWPLYAMAAFILVAAIAIVAVALLPESAGVTVSIKAPATVSAGGDFVATVNISGVTNFDSAVYYIEYDPEVLEVLAVNGGTVNNTEVPVDDWGFTPSGIQGEVAIINNIVGVPGVNGSGHLSEIHFHVIGSSGDTSSLSFVLEEVSMVDNTAKYILATWVGDSITVQ